MGNISEKHFKILGISLLANIIAIPIAGYLFYSISTQNVKIQEIYDNQNQHIGDINKKHENELAKTVKDYERRIKENYEQLSNVIHDSSAVNTSLDVLKQTIVNTNNASSADIQKIEDVLLGLSYLIGQYEKPLYNFKEIEHYIVRKLDIVHLPPNKRLAFIKRIFSKKYRKILLEYHKKEGEHVALIDMRDKIHNAYEKAQTEISASRNGIMDHVKALQIMNRERKYDNQKLIKMIASAQEVLDIHSEFVRLK